MLLCMLLGAMLLGAETIMLLGAETISLQVHYQELDDPFCDKQLVAKTDHGICFVIILYDAPLSFVHAFILGRKPCITAFFLWEGVLLTLYKSVHVCNGLLNSVL